MMGIRVHFPTEYSAFNSVMRIFYHFLSMKITNLLCQEAQKLLRELETQISSLSQKVFLVNVRWFLDGFLVEVF